MCLTRRGRDAFGAAGKMSALQLFQGVDFLSAREHRFREGKIQRVLC